MRRKAIVCLRSVAVVMLLLWTSMLGVNAEEAYTSWDTMNGKVSVRDDNGNLFGFGTHIYRHCYGVKLTEMHLDDWTIAKLLGHSSVRNVKYYRRMSNQLLADETRKARQRLSEIILSNLDGWEDEYEQRRKDDSL